MRNEDNEMVQPVKTVLYFYFIDNEARQQICQYIDCRISKIKGWLNLKEYIN